MVSAAAIMPKGVFCRKRLPLHSEFLECSKYAPNTSSVVIQFCELTIPASPAFAPVFQATVPCTHPTTPPQPHKSFLSKLFFVISTLLESQKLQANVDQRSSPTSPESPPISCPTSKQCSAPWSGVAPKVDSCRNPSSPFPTLWNFRPVSAPFSQTQ